MKITAIDIVKHLDGMSIDAAKRTLEQAIRLLTSTQRVFKIARFLTPARFARNRLRRLFYRQGFAIEKINRSAPIIRFDVDNLVAVNQNLGIVLVMKQDQIRHLRVPISYA